MPTSMPTNEFDQGDARDYWHPDRASLDTLARQWRAASDQAFTAAAHDPQTYIRATRLVGALSAHLRTLGSGAAPLLGAWRRHREIVLRVAADDDLLTTDGVDLATVAAAAFAMRHREVAQEIAADERRAAMSARPADAWSVLEERGYAPGDPFVPYRRLEVHPATGRALLITTAPDENYQVCIHQVQVLAIDAATGELSAADGDGRPASVGGGQPAPVEEFASASEREAHVARVKTHHPE